jgi:hypothetical protein
MRHAILEVGSTSQTRFDSPELANVVANAMRAGAVPGVRVKTWCDDCQTYHDADRAPQHCEACDLCTRTTTARPGHRCSTLCDVCTQEQADWYETSRAGWDEAWAL